MTLQTSGPISFADIVGPNGLNRPGTVLHMSSDTDALALIGKVTGQAVYITDFYGRSTSTNITYTFASSVANASLNVSTISGYISGVINNITIIVNYGVYLYSTGTGTPGLTINGASALDVITLTDNGYIIGMGGGGGGADSNDTYHAPGVGGPALSIAHNVTINGSGYIAGGGGGGGFAQAYGYTSGGGGAGGGAGGGDYETGCCGNPDVYFAGGTGGDLGGTGGNGQGGAAGGGGGRILPGVGGQGTNNIGIGGGAGGGGGSNGYAQSAGSGGSAGNPGNPPVSGITAAGGGGGWGAAGGSSGHVGGGITETGAAGGKAIQLNGYSASYSGVTVYGAVA